MDTSKKALLQLRRNLAGLRANTANTGREMLLCSAPGIKCGGVQVWMSFFGKQAIQQVTSVRCGIEFPADARFLPMYRWSTAASPEENTRLIIASLLCAWLAGSYFGDP